jgi:hypothetical protein
MVSHDQLQSPSEVIMSKTSKFFTNLASYEAEHKEPDHAGNPQIKARSAFILIATLLLFLVAFTCFLMEAPMRPKTIDLVESVLFGIAGLVGSLRFYYARKR